MRAVAFVLAAALTLEITFVHVLGTAAVHDGLKGAADRLRQEPPLPPGGGAAPLGQQLLTVQVFHRHGARTPLVPINQTAICGPRGNTSCGILTDVGKEQLTSLGTYLRQRYNSLIPELNASDSYDFNVLYSRSTNLPRTLQSSASMLRGVYPDLSAFYPVIHTVRFGIDRLCLIDAQMSFHILDQLGGYFTMSNASLKIFSHADLRAMAEQAGIQAACGVFPAQYVECAGLLQDIAASALSAGTLSSQYPLLAQQFSNLQEFRRAINNARFPYDPSDPNQLMRGSYGQLLAQRLVSNFVAAQGALQQQIEQEQLAEDRASAGGGSDLSVLSDLDRLDEAFLARGASSPPAPASGGATQAPLWPLPRIYEYSIHDTTIMPLSATLGHNELMLPLFGETLILELWRDVSTNSLTVKMLSGRPNQTFANHTIEMAYIATVCQDTTTGAVYNSTAGCPLADFWSFINSSAPIAQHGSCYLPASAIKQIACDTIGQPTTPLCTLYRERCPETGCPSGYVVDTNTLGCVALEPRPSLVTPTIMIIEVLAAVCVGMALAVAFADVARRRREAAQNTQRLQRGGYEAVARSAPPPTASETVDALSHPEQPQQQSAVTVPQQQQPQASSRGSIQASQQPPTAPPAAAAAAVSVTTPRLTGTTPRGPPPPLREAGGSEQTAHQHTPRGPPPPPASGNTGGKVTPRGQRF